MKNDEVDQAIARAREIEAKALQAWERVDTDDTAAPEPERVDADDSAERIALEVEREAADAWKRADDSAVRVSRTDAPSPIRGFARRG